jgi:hypothetical protein
LNEGKKKGRERTPPAHAVTTEVANWGEGADHVVYAALASEWQTRRS